MHGSVSLPNIETLAMEYALLAHSSENDASLYDSVRIWNEIARRVGTEYGLQYIQQAQETVKLLG